MSVRRVQWFLIALLLGAGPAQAALHGVPPAAGGALSGDASATTATATGGSASRTLADHFGDVVRAEDYGLVGDGTTNNCGAPLTAFIAAGAGKTMKFKAGVYKFNTCNIVITVDRTWLDGDGLSTILDFTSYTGISGEGAVWFKPTTPSAGTFINKVGLTNLGLRHAASSSAGSGLRLEQVVNFNMENVVISDFFLGVEILGSTNVFLDKSQIPVGNYYASLESGSRCLVIKSGDNGAGGRRMSFNIFMNELQMGGPNGGTPMVEHCVDVLAADGVYMSNSYVGSADQNVYLSAESAASGLYVANVVLSGMFLDGAFTSRIGLNIAYNAAAPAFITSTISVGGGTIISGYSEKAVTIGAGITQGVQISNTLLGFADDWCFDTEASHGITLSSNMFYLCGTNSDSSTGSARFQAGVLGPNSITGNTFVYSRPLNHALEISDNTVAAFSVTGNSFGRSASAFTEMTFGTITHLTVTGNETIQAGALAAILRGALSVGGALTSTGAFTASSTANVVGQLNADADTEIGTAAGTARILRIRAAAGNARSLLFSSGTSTRWQVSANSTAESGSNAGSDFRLNAYDDSGVFIDAPISIARAAAGLFSIPRPLTVTGAVNINVGNNATTIIGTGSTTSSVSIGGANNNLNLSATGGSIGFFGAGASTRPGATVDLGTVLSTLGLRTAGTAYPITTSGAINLTGAITLNGTDVTITDPQWSVSGAGAAAFTALTTTGVAAIGNSSATVAVNSSDWDIDATGVATGLGNITSDGNLTLSAAGGGVLVKEGSNATMGTCTLVVGTCTVSTTKVTANSRIFLTAQVLGTVAVAQGMAVTARTAATSFVISSSSATDTSTIAWIIFEPAP